MRTMILCILILALWSGATSMMAQLPPEILADSHLLRAEQAIRDGDTVRARAEIDKITLLQKENELKLSEEFHFRYAKAAAAAELAKPALAGVESYLLAAGRNGQHYVEALVLLNRLRDEIEKTQVATLAQRNAESAADAGDIKGSPQPSSDETAGTAEIRGAEARPDGSGGVASGAVGGNKRSRGNRPETAAVEHGFGCGRDGPQTDWSGTRSSQGQIGREKLKWIQLERRESRKSEIAQCGPPGSQPGKSETA